jgi:hypothetical protein
MTYEDLPQGGCTFYSFTPPGESPPGAPVSNEGVHTLYAAAIDRAGNTSAPVSLLFQIDSTPPIIECDAPTPLMLLHSGDHAVTPSEVYAGPSGLNQGASTLSGSVPTNSIGPKSINFTATDIGGNQTVQACGFNVIYDFGGPYPPVSPPPVLNPVKAGQATPVKFSLAGNQGLNVISGGYPASQAVGCNVREPIGPLEAAGQPGKSGLSYDPTSGLYSIVWKTSKEWAGTCRGLVIQFADGTKHWAYFQFR